MISVRVLDPHRDECEVLGLLQENLPYLPHGRLYNWLYRNNPEGQALLWAAVDAESDRMLGVAAAFPRRVFCGGKELRGFILGDFCINASNRSLGSALQLQRSCLEGVRAQGDFVIDFPSAVMLAVYKRLRIEAKHAVVRLAKLLRANQKIKQTLSSGPLSDGVSAVMNLGLALGTRRPRVDARWKIALEPGPWGAEFTIAARQWSRNMGICVARTEAFLNWRYRNHPIRSYEMLTAREGEKLIGWLVSHTDGENVVIDDILGETDSIKTTLVKQALSAARERGLCTASAPWLEKNPGVKILMSCGFRPRETCPVVAMQLSPADAENGKADLNWYLSDGDREA